MFCSETDINGEKEYFTLLLDGALKEKKLPEIILEFEKVRDENYFKSLNEKSQEGRNENIEFQKAKDGNYFKSLLNEKSRRTERKQGKH